MSSISDEIAKLNQFSMPQQEDPAQARARLAKWVEEEAARIKNLPYSPSRLDYFAAAALQGFLAGSECSESPEYSAEAALSYAQAMIAVIDSPKTE